MICSGPPLVVISRNQDLLGYTVQGNNSLQNSELSAGSWHTVTGAGSFALADGDSACFKDGLHAHRTISAHAGQDDSHGCRPKFLGYRKHGYVHGRSVQRTRRLMRKTYTGWTGGSAINSHMQSGRSDVNGTRQYFLAVIGLLHGEFAELVKSTGKWTGGPCQNRDFGARGGTHGSRLAHMTSDQLQKLRDMNGKLESLLHQMNEPGLLTSSPELAELLQSVVDAGEWIKDTSIPLTDMDGESIMLSYRTLLERLRGVLPLMEVRLRMERARLESERSQLASVAEWRAATKETVSTR